MTLRFRRDWLSFCSVIWENGSSIFSVARLGPRYCGMIFWYSFHNWSYKTEKFCMWWEPFLKADPVHCVTGCRWLFCFPCLPHTVVICTTRFGLFGRGLPFGNRWNVIVRERGRTTTGKGDRVLGFDGWLWRPLRFHTRGWGVPVLWSRKYSLRYIMGS